MDTLTKRPKQVIKSNKKPYPIIAVLITLLAIIIVLVLFYQYRISKEPMTKEELMPMMDEAVQLDGLADDLSGWYAPIEAQTGEADYFAAQEEDYAAASEIQRESIQRVQRQEELVAEAGGIATFEDLQEHQTQVQDPFIAEQIRKQFEQQKFD